MAIVKPNQLNFNNKKFSMIISGYPGIGKTTLALSAPKPLLVDLDNQGIGRVLPQHRKDVLQVKDYDELIKDLQSNDLKEYETIVFDTGGKLLEFLKPAVIKENPGNGQKDGTLSIKGYGAVSRKFKHIMKLCNDMNKHVILIFHTKEEKDGDNVKLRIQVEGSTKDNIWQDVDMGGFMEMRGKEREISFANCERFFAKGVFGITGNYILPNVSDPLASNDYLTKLFELAQKNASAESEEARVQREDYNDIMKRFKAEFETIETVVHVNELKLFIEETEHALTSEKECKQLLHKKAVELGFTFDKEKGIYTNEKA